MRLHFNHGGRQFFFATFTVAGRRPLLSRIVEGEKRPELTSLGEAVKAALLAIHEVWPSAGISDFVIMPDHVHVIIICNYDKGQKASPLFMAHRVMDAVEAASGNWIRKDGAPPRTPAFGEDPQPTAQKRDSQLPPYPPTPAFGGNPPTSVHMRFPASSVNQGEMPGQSTHSHSRAMAPMMAELIRESIHRYNALPQGDDGRHEKAGQRGSGRCPVHSAPQASPPKIFDRSCYIQLSFDACQLHAIRRYIKLNPARAIWKAKNPDMFLRHRGIRARVLDPSRQWDAMGELALLGSPFLFHVRLTMKKTAAEHKEAIDEIIEKARRGMVPVSGFISPGEKEALRRLKAEPGARFVKMLPYGLPPRYDPSAEDSRELAAHRLLILTGFPQSRKDDRSSFHRNCLEMNDLAAAICREAGI